MKKVVLGLGAAALLASGGIVFAQAGHGEGPRGHMAKIDANNDGQITRAEMMASVEARFAKGDANGDGRLDKTDRAAMGEQRRAAMWQKLDSDSNGSVSKAEWDAAHTLRMADREERKDKRQAMRAQGKGGEMAMRGRMMRHGMKAKRAHGMMRLSQADTNNDQVVTLAEARTLATKHFDMLDADKNGVATKAEMEAMRAKHRTEPKTARGN